MTATTTPAPQRTPDTSATPPVGRTELGTITIDKSVVTKIASRVASEVPDAGPAGRRLLGASLPGAGWLPKASADVDGSVVAITLSIGVRWPCSVPAVTQAVRQRVRERVSALTGLNVTEVTIAVTDLLTHSTRPPQIH